MWSVAVRVRQRRAWLAPVQQGTAAGQPVAKRLYTVQEAAVYLGRLVWGVRELIWKGELPCVKVGRRIHIDAEDLDVFIQRHKILENRER